VDESDIKVWDKSYKDSPINAVKLFAKFEDVTAQVLYDVLHDPDYRKVWDDKMVEGFLIEQLDKFNDVGYYSAKAPMGVTNRDWVNQRSWRVIEDKEYIIMNHSVAHSAQGEKKGFVRANSILSGYLVRVAEKGCILLYITQNDPRGWLPAWLMNKVTKSFAPQIIDKMHKACLGYEDWKSKNNPTNRPWR